MNPRFGKRNFSSFRMSNRMTTGFQNLIGASPSPVASGPTNSFSNCFPKNSFLLNFFTETNWKLACPAHSSHFPLLLLLFPQENFQAYQRWHPEGPLGAQLLPISSSTSQNTSSQRQLLVSQVYLHVFLQVYIIHTYMYFIIIKLMFLARRR